MIFHLAEKATWEASFDQQFYSCASLIQEGFIHCSTREQLLATANRYYQGRNDLLLLCLNEEKLTASLVYEKSPSTGEFFPHLYGPINKTAILKTIPFLPDAQGIFKLNNLDGSDGIF